MKLAHSLTPKARHRRAGAWMRRMYNPVPHMVSWARWAGCPRPRPWKVHHTGRLR